jgi:DNA-binding winged helix-turn-helix (wHTH) protein
MSAAADRGSQPNFKRGPTRLHETSRPLRAIESADAWTRTTRMGLKEFPPFLLDTVNQSLWRRREAGDDERISLAPKGFALLRYLVEHAGRLVTQDELLDALWPDTFVQPEVLKSHILDIRRSLGDDSKNPRFIETLPRRGYQFVALIKGVPAESTPGLELLGRKLVGRNAALARLSNSLQTALRGTRQVVFVTGDTGIGKTTLVDEFQRQVAADAIAIRLGRGQCVEGYGGTEAYYPMLEALGQLCRGTAGDSIVQILATQAPTWLVQFPALVKREQRETLQREILGATRERMLREISEALEIIASERPLLLVFEDLHWADRSTVDLISALARRRQSAKLLLIGTYRPVDITHSNHPLKALEQDLLIHHLCREIELEPLEEAAVTEYLAVESGGAAVPEGLAGLIYRYTEGNPLFMVTVLEDMRERKLITRENGSLTLSLPLEEIELRVPDSLQQMIEIQIARLSEEEHRALEVASVAGALFSTAVAAPAANMEVESFEGLCERLSRKHQIVRLADAQEFPDGLVSGRYEFDHALYREVLYHNQSPGRRAKLHLQVGKRLEGLYAQRLSEAAPELAHHFEQAGDWPRAINYLQLAAEAAGQRFGPRQAALILEHALELVNKLPGAERGEREITILEELGTICDASLDSRAIEASVVRSVARADRTDCWETPTSGNCHS